MKSFCFRMAVVLSLLFTTTVLADNQPLLTNSLTNLESPSALNTTKAARDTIFLVGPWSSGAQFNGQFQDEQGNPAWNGWTHQDLTLPSTSHWHISDYQAESLGANPGPGNLAAWCGSPFLPACSAQDMDGGYGNNWNDLIQWVSLVDDNSIGANVHFTAYANIDSEPGYDYTYIRYLTADGPVDAASYDDNHPNEFIDVAFSLDPQDYQGENQDQIVIQVAFRSDSAWSDADCLWGTAGAVQIDDITVTIDQGAGETQYFTDFQDGLGGWEVTFPQGVGDFTALWQNLEDIDPCNSNYSPQVAFIDDGLVVPGSGPAFCIDWCYGPGGYIVNTTGGLLGPENYVHNAVISPVMDWPGESYNGAKFDFDLYIHEDLSADAPGVFATWSVRSADTVDDSGNPTGYTIEEAPWLSSGWVYYGGPYYLRGAFEISSALVEGRDEFQVQFECLELGYVWGYVGNDGYPAPYVDNIRVSAFSTYGPATNAASGSLANDNFPAIGEIDLVNLENNSVRFDRGATFLNEETGDLLAGDTVYFSVEPLRPGAVLANRPEVHFLVKQNPLFDEFRTNPEFGAAPSGTVLADSARNAAGVIPGGWVFDLPDSNFLFPGDVIHYFITGTDGGGPDNLPWETVTLPADTSGFSRFIGPLSYSNNFTMRALPSVFEDPSIPGELRTPKVLVWQDSGTNGYAEWFGAMNNLGLVCGRDYDVYYTNGPGTGYGNGIGGRATPYSLIGYEDFLYSSGTSSVMTISSGNIQVDSGNDIGVLDNWLRLGDRDLLLTGDSFITDLVTNAGPTGIQFVEDWLKVNYFNYDIRPLIGNQTTPLVRSVAGNGVFQDEMTWVAFGGCFAINTFDAVEADQDNGGIRLAEYLSPAGAGDYPYSAATLYQDTDTGSRVITMPVDFSFIYTDPSGDKVNAPLPTRALVLEQILAFFGVEGDPLDVSPVPEAARFTVRNFPNPFNPSTRIEYTLAKPGHLTLKVYNLRGELVKTLIDEPRETSGFVVWDGTDNQDSQVASGVYFYEARAAGEVKVQKMVLVK